MDEQHGGRLAGDGEPAQADERVEPQPMAETEIGRVRRPLSSDLYGSAGGGRALFEARRPNRPGAMRHSPEPPPVRHALGFARLVAAAW